MASNQSLRSPVVEKLAALSPTQQAEVEDFIDFLGTRDPEHLMHRALLRQAEIVFAPLWDNPDDAAYDHV